MSYGIKPVQVFESFGSDKQNFKNTVDKINKPRTIYLNPKKFEKSQVVKDEEKKELEPPRKEKYYSSPIKYHAEAQKITLPQNKNQDFEKKRTKKFYEQKRF